MILWLPIALILAFVGSGFLYTAHEAVEHALSDMDEDTPQWVYTFGKHFFFVIFSFLAAILLTAAYLLTKLALGL